jgi:hypothetical protein
MRKGFDGLALLVQETLKRNPHAGHLFVFRGRRGSLTKVLWYHGEACACSPSGSNAGVLCGHRRLRARARAARGDDHASAAGIFVGRH